MLDETAEGNLFAALRVREADLEKHLPAARAPRSQGRRAREGARGSAQEARGSQQAPPQTPPKPPPEFGSAEDFQLHPGAQPLKGKPCWSARPWSSARPRSTRPTERPSVPDRRPCLPRATEARWRDGRRRPAALFAPPPARRIGIEGQRDQLLLAAHALVIGAGGLGSPVALQRQIPRHGRACAVGRITDRRRRLHRPLRRLSPTCSARSPIGLRA
jgi:hypothetical protein